MGVKIGGKSKQGNEWVFQMEEDMSASMSFKLAGQFRHDWKTSGSVEVTETYNSTKDQNCLWQYVWSVNTWKYDTGFHSCQKNFLTDHMARTAGQFQPPKCLPGGALDLPKYQKCAEGFEL